MTMLIRHEPSIEIIDTNTIEIRIPDLPDEFGRIKLTSYFVPWKLNNTVRDYLPEGLEINRIILDGLVLHEEDYDQVSVRCGAILIIIPTFGWVGIAIETVFLIVGIILTAVSIALQFILAPSLPNLSPKASSRGGEGDATSFGFSGFKLELHAGVPIPVIYGTHKVAGVLISSFLKVKDEDPTKPTRDVFNLLILLSHGEIEGVSDIKINNQPYTNFKDVTIDYRLGLASQTAILGFEEVANTVEMQLLISNAGVTYTTTVGRDIIALELVIRWANGLFNVDNNGGMQSNSYTYRVEYRLTGVGSYTIAGDRTVTRALRSQITNIFRIEKLAPGQYDIRVTKIGSATSEDPVRAAWDATLSGVTEITGSGRTYNNYAILGIRGVATDQLSGSIPNVTCIVKGRRLKQYLTVVIPPFPQCTAVVSTTPGLITAGFRQYVVTFITAGGETLPSSPSVPLSVPINSQVNLSNIPVSAHGSVTGRKIYRNKGRIPNPIATPTLDEVFSFGGAIEEGSYDYCVTFITADGGETLSGPVSKSGGISFSNEGKIKVGNIESSSFSVSGRRLYRRRTANGIVTSFRLVATIEDNSTSTYFDTKATSALGKTLSPLNTAQISSVFSLVGTIANNTATTFTDNIADISLGASAPATNTATVSAYWGTGWSDNPAWPVRDMLVDTRYGLGRWILETDVNDQSFIDGAAFCNTLVSDGFSGNEKRAVIDLLINSLRSALDLLVEDLCGPHRLALLVSNGKWTLLADTVTAPTQLFSMGNIIRDSFKIQYASTREQFNTFQIQFFDRSKDYEVEAITVVSKPQVEDAGLPQKLRAQSIIGVTRQSQIVRESRYHLNVAYYIRRAIEFEADVDSILMEAGDTFWFQHSLPEIGQLGGRVIAAANGPATITLDQDITLNPATTYKIRVRSLDGSGNEVFQEKTITNSSGTYVAGTAFTVDTSWTTIPANMDVYAFGSVTSATFRTLSIEDSGNNHRKISAIEYNASIYTDTGPVTVIPVSSLPNPTSPPVHVQDTVIVEELVTVSSGHILVTAVIQWNRGPTGGTFGLYGGARLFYSNVFTGGEFKSLAVLQGEDAKEYRWVNAPLNIQTFVKIVSISPFGISSSFDTAPISEFTFIQTLTAPQDITGLELFNQGSDTNFLGKDAKFRWNVGSLFLPGIEPFIADSLNYTSIYEALGIRDFLIAVLVNGREVRQEYVNRPEYVYTLEKNIEDNGVLTPAQAFTFSVRARSRANILSENPALLTVQNPLPNMSMVTPTATSVIDLLIVDWSTYTQIDYDLEYFLVLMDIFTPPTTEVLRVSKDHLNASVTGLKANTKYYIQIVPVDPFGAGTPSVISSAVTAGKVGYKQTLNFKVFTPTVTNEIHVASIVFDTIDKEVDWLAKSGSDMHWGETTQNAAVATALGSKFTGETKVRSCWDGINHQIGLMQSDTSIKYAKIDKDGSIITSPTAKFALTGTDKFISFALVARGSYIYWVFIRDVYSGATFLNSKVQYAKTDLSGTIITALTDVDTTSNVAPGEEIKCGVDSDNNIHIFYKRLTIDAFQNDAFQNDAFQIGSAQPMMYVKISSSGMGTIWFVLIPETAFILPPSGSVDISPSAVIVDNNDIIHVIGYTYTGSGIMLSYARATKNGILDVPATIFFSMPTTIKFSVGCMDLTLNQIYCAIADSTGLYLIRLDPVDPTGLTIDNTFPRASL